MNKDQVKGRIKKVKGNAKKIAGKIAGDKDLEREGKIDNTRGKVQEKYGDAKKGIKESI